MAAFFVGVIDLELRPLRPGRWCRCRFSPDNHHSLLFLRPSRGKPRLFVALCKRLLRGGSANTLYALYRKRWHGRKLLYNRREYHLPGGIAAQGVYFGGGQVLPAHGLQQHLGGQFAVVELGEGVCCHNCKHFVRISFTRVSFMGKQYTTQSLSVNTFSSFNGYFAILVLLAPSIEAWP